MIDNKILKFLQKSERKWEEIYHKFGTEFDAEDLRSNLQNLIKRGLVFKHYDANRLYYYS